MTHAFPTRLASDLHDPDRTRVRRHEPGRGGRQPRLVVPASADDGRGNGPSRSRSRRLRLTLPCSQEDAMTTDEQTRVTSHVLLVMLEEDRKSTRLNSSH